MGVEVLGFFFHLGKQNLVPFGFLFSPLCLIRDFLLSLEEVQILLPVWAYGEVRRSFCMMCIRSPSTLARLPRGETSTDWSGGDETAKVGL